MLSPAIVRRDFDRIAETQLHRRERLHRYERELLEQMPASRKALDVGCGIGIVSRAMARRAMCVDAIDLSPRMIDIARTRTSNASIHYQVADLLTTPLLTTPLDTYDCIVSIGTLHHLPLENALRVLRRALTPGGRLLILDLFESRTLLDRSLDIVALFGNLPNRLRERRDRETRRAWSQHHDVLTPLATIRAIAERALPGARIRRRLYWRYELVWDSPRGARSVSM